MSILVNNTTSASIAILQRTNELFGITQKRVASGKRVFSAADDTTRYKASETLLGRSRQLSDINNNITLGLATLEATDKTLNTMLGLIESALTLANKAQNEGGADNRSATTTANIDSSTVVTGVVVGSRFSITSDTGKNFTYIFNSTGVTWGDIANALNASNTGVIASFPDSTVSGQKNIRFSATNNDEDFTFDAITDQNVMDDLIGLTSPSGQVFNPVNLFANGVAAPTANETGFAVTYGGRITGIAGAGVTPATVIPAGTVITYEDGFGGFRSHAWGAATTLATVMTDINALGSGIKAELVNQTGGGAGPTQLRLRNQNGGSMKIIAAAGAFDVAGVLGFPGPGGYGSPAPLSADNALRLSYGQQYDAIILNLDSLVANNPVPLGRNLLLGQNVNVVMDEFADNPVKIAGVAVTAAGTLTMAQAGVTWTSDLNIQTSAVQARRAGEVLRGLQAQFATFNNYIRARHDLNRAYQGELKTQGDEVVAADISEESASLIALQTRQEFAVQAITIGNQNDQSLLRLLG